MTNEQLVLAHHQNVNRFVLYECDNMYYNGDLCSVAKQTQSDRLSLVY